MATSLVVCTIEASVAQALKGAAARDERSAEAELQEILRAALA
jgi:plasmid stability protein